MKKTFSIDYSNRLGVLVKKTKKGFVLQDKYDFRDSPDSEFFPEIEKLIKKYNSILSYEFNDYINQQVEIPQVKDNKTKQFLIKSKLSNVLEKGKEYKFIYFPEGKNENKIIYNVFAVPLDILYKDIKIDFSLKKSLNKFLLSQFSLLGISYQLFGEKTVFHCYADEESIIITVNKGEELKYTRVVQIDKEISEEHRNNIYYENINLTYQYVMQNKTKQIDFVIFSGNLAENIDVIQSAYAFLNKPISTVFVPNLISNCDTQTFHKFVIPIGNLFVPEKYNLLPDEFIQNQVFNKILVYANFALFVLIIFILSIDFSKYSEANQKLSWIDRDYRSLIREISAFRKEFGIPVEHLEYYSAYFNKLTDIKEKDILFNVFDFGYFLKSFKINKFDIDKTSGNIQIQISGLKKFNDLKSFVRFKENLKNRIQQLSEKYVLQDNTSYNFQQLTIHLNINLAGK